MHETIQLYLGNDQPKGGRAVLARRYVPVNDAAAPAKPNPANSFILLPSTAEPPLLLEDDFQRTRNATLCKEYL